MWRIYSMTKPITSVAAMMLYEEGGFELTDPVYRYIPSFRDVRVFAGGSDISYKTVPATEPIRIWHLLSHTSGLTYGFMRNHPVDAIYRARGFEWGSPRGADLAASATSSPRCRCCSSPVPSGATRSRPTYSAGWSRWCPASGWMSSSPAGSSGRSA